MKISYPGFDNYSSRFQAVKLPKNRQSEMKNQCNGLNELRKLRGCGVELILRLNHIGWASVLNLKDEFNGLNEERSPMCYK